MVVSRTACGVVRMVVSCVMSFRLLSVIIVHPSFALNSPKGCNSSMEIKIYKGRFWAEIYGRFHQ